VTTGKKTSNTVHIDIDEAEDHREGVIDEDANVPVSGAVASDVVDEDNNPLDTLPKEAVKNADGSVTLPLFEEVTLTTRKDGRIRKKEFSELTFHRLKGSDMRAIGAARDDDKAVVTFARCTRLNQAVMNAIFDKLDGVDIANGGRVVNYFLNSSLPSGR
jgi:hypothetical protein